MDDSQLRPDTEALFRYSPSGMLLMDVQGLIQRVNPAGGRLLKRPAAALQNRPLAELLHSENPPATLQALQALQAGTQPDARLPICLRDQNHAPLWLTLSATNLANEAGFRVTVVILEEQAPARPPAPALFHPHSRLPIPALLEDRLAQLLRFQDSHPLAVLRVGLGSAPLAKDELALLQRQTARALARSLPRRASCGHCREGDYAVILPGADLRTLLAVARDLHHQLQRPHRLRRRRSLQLYASLGIAVCPEDGDDAASLLRQALEARRQGSGPFRFADPELQQRATALLEFETALATALTRGELLLHYQPIQKAASGSLTAVEALLRWQHPDRGLLFPRAFLEQLEQSPQIVVVGEHLLRQACRQVQEWRRQRPVLVLTMNVFTGYFASPRFVASVAAILAECGFPAQNLTLEITEQTLMNNPLQSAETIRRVTELGVAVAIDDVGNHWRTQTELRHLPVQALKLDRRLTPDRSVDHSQAALVAILARYTQQHDLQLTAKGIETEAQRDSCRALPCDLLQGFLLGRPMPAREFHAWLEHQTESDGP